MKKGNDKAKASLEAGNIDQSDIKTIVFDIFSKRKQFNYKLKERVWLYLGFLAPVLKCLRRCRRSWYFENMIEVNKIFENAVGRLDSECDIIDVMKQVRKSKNFMRNHLRREQKILLKFDYSNVIDANSESEEGSAEEEEVLDQDEIISKNLNSTNGLVAMW
jgi:hypothetical protein